MKKIIRLSESDLVKLVRRVVKESAVGTSSMDRIQMVFDCTGLQTAGAGWTAQVSEIASQMPILSELMASTDDLNMGSFVDWDEKGILNVLRNLGSNKAEFTKIQKVLACYMKKMNVPMEQNNPLMTLARKAFQTKIGGMKMTDFMGGDDVRTAQTYLSRLGIKL